MVTKLVASLRVPVNAAAIDTFLPKLPDMVKAQANRESYVHNVQSCNTRVLVIKGDSHARMRSVAKTQILKDWVLLWRFIL
jgi:hypothetical protein